MPAPYMGAPWMMGAGHLLLLGDSQRPDFTRPPFAGKERGLARTASCSKGQGLAHWHTAFRSPVAQSAKQYSADCCPVPMCVFRCWGAGPRVAAGDEWCLDTGCVQVAHTAAAIGEVAFRSPPECHFPVCWGLATGAS